MKMETLHKYSFSKIEKGIDFEEVIKRKGIPYQHVQNAGGRNYHLHIVINEDHPEWKWLENKSEEYEALNIFVTIFSRDEKLAAEWLVARPDKEAGYLEPKNNWDKQKKYICNTCGTFINDQTLRVNINKAPRSMDVFTLISENLMMVLPHVEKELIKQGLSGLELKDVFYYKTDEKIKEFREFRIINVAKPGLVGWDHLRLSPCPACGTVKYKCKQKGMMKYYRSVIPEGVDCFWGNEWWGEGLVAFQQIIVSNRVAKLFLEKGWKGVDFQPVELVEG
jgi:hypothetical protein